MRATSFEGLDAYLTAEVGRVEVALERAVTRAESAGGPLTPEVLATIRHGVLSGGKRLRPILCVAAYRACAGDDAAVGIGGGVERAGGATGGHDDALYDLAVSLELIHAYSLMHDDLPCMDDAELRRGRETTHRVHGEETTMLAGAALIPVAALRALEACRALGCETAVARRVAGHLMRAAGGGGMVGGQWLDLLGEGRALGPEALGDLHARKTGALLSASLVMGALAAAAPAERVDAVGSYGRHVGLAFQIADDVLDATASAEALGKNPSDTDLDKSTYVAMYGLEEARRRASAEVDAALGALEAARVASPALVALARYVVERER